MATKVTTPELIDLPNNQLATVNADGVVLPKGTTATRPASAVDGEFRYNTTTNKVEYYDGAGWFTLNSSTIIPQSGTTGACNYPTTASALYQLNDNANDTCGSYNGTEIGSPTYVTGKFGKAIDLNGTTQGVELPSILSSNSTSDSSFTGWFKTSDTSGNQQTIVSSWNGSTTANNGGWAVFKDAGNVLRLSNYYLTSGASGTDGTTNVADGDWHFIAVVFDYSGATLSLYLDGNSTPEVQISSLTPGTVNIFSGSNCSLGYQIPGGPTRYFPGSIDQCRIFPSALTATQIGYLYTETAP